MHESDERSHVISAAARSGVGAHDAECNYNDGTRHRVLRRGDETSIAGKERVMRVTDD